jgi:methyltransferase family protein
MADYTQMSDHYDLIMTSGYYDYEAIAADIAGRSGPCRVLEIGAGTGLILERLVSRRPDLMLAGVDLTAAMLDIARPRLRGFPQVTLHRQDVVALELGQTFDLAFSYGGVWYFVPADDGEFSLISHIRDDEENGRGLARVAAHLEPDGRLLLGVQAPHVDYAGPVANGMEYAQRITPIPGGFRKQYRLTDAGSPVMAQTTEYRVYGFSDAMQLMKDCGFEYRPVAGPSLFLEFGRS